MAAPVIGILAIQGSYALHQRALRALGASTCWVRRPADLQGLDGLVLPGGESTVMADLARESGLYEELERAGRQGLPMFGTCAGAILLGEGEPRPPRLGLAPLVVDRNAYGRQIDSFEAPLELPQIDPSGRPFPGIFIRAPKMRPGPQAAAEDRVQVLATWEGEAVLARHENFLLATFHPELTADLRVHEVFLQTVHARRAGHESASSPDLARVSSGA